MFENDTSGATAVKSVRGSKGVLRYIDTLIAMTPIVPIIIV